MRWISWYQFQAQFYPRILLPYGKFAWKDYVRRAERDVLKENVHSIWFGFCNSHPSIHETSDKASDPAFCLTSKLNVPFYIVLTIYVINSVYNKILACASSVGYFEVRIGNIMREESHLGWFSQSFTSYMIFAFGKV